MALSLLLLSLSAAGSTAFAPAFLPSAAPSSPFSPLSMVASSSSAVGEPGTADLDWANLGFEFRPTKSHLKVVWSVTDEETGEGAWGEPEMVEGDPYINLHVGATALHYGQSCFEGLKAFAHGDGSVHLFRPDENAKRIRSSCERLMMPAPPPDFFVEACARVVADNVAYVPPHGSGGALYLRPLLFGSGPRIGLQPADEYTLLILVMPVGDYYKGGLSNPVDALIIDDFDRAAPRGVGSVKVAGNYAADLLPNMLGKKRGYPIGLYLDAETQTTVEEFSTSNFVGIDNGEKNYVTPKSASVLPSITNKSLMQVAEDEGYRVERRDVPLDELETFDEVMAVGTAVVVTPVGSATRLGAGDEVKVKYEFSNEVGETTRKFYDIVRGIQSGEVEDKHGWNYKVE